MRRQFLFVSTFSLSHLLSFWFPPPSFSLPPGPWKDLVIKIGSKCDISSRSCSPTLPFLTPTPPPPCPSLRSACFGPCHHHALCGSSHGGGEPSLANYRTPDESERERDRESSPLFLAPDIGPIRDFPLRTYPSLSLWSLDLLNRWNEHFEEGLSRWTRSSLCWPGVNSCLFWFVSYTQTFMHTVFGFEGLSRQVLGVLWVMTNVIMLPFTLL